MRYPSEIFWRQSWNVGTLVRNNFDVFVCLSVCSMAYFLTKIRQIKGYLQLWMKYLSGISQRYSLDVSTLVPNIFKFLVRLSVC